MHKRFNLEIKEQKYSNKQAFADYLQTETRGNKKACKLPIWEVSKQPLFLRKRAIQVALGQLTENSPL